MLFLYIVLGIIAFFVLCIALWIIIGTIRGSRSREYLARQHEKYEKQQKANKEKLELYDEQQRRVDNRLMKGAERIKRNEEISKRVEESSKALGILEQQIRKNLFTESEMLKITKEKNHATELALHATEATEHLTKLIKKQTHLTLSFKDKDKELLALDKEIEEATQRLHAYDGEIFACCTAIEKWVTLGKQREANSEDT